MAKRFSRRILLPEQLESRLFLYGIPVTPADLQTFPVSRNEIDLQWGSIDPNAHYYHVQRSTDGNNFTTISTGGSPHGNYSDRTVEPGIDYSYRVYASNDIGASGYSNVAESSVLPLNLSTGVLQLPQFPNFNQIADIFPSAVETGPGGSLFVVQSNGLNNSGAEVWRTDGTRAGTERITRLSEGTIVESFGYQAGLFFFNVRTAAGQFLYRTDGTEAGTIQLALLGTDHNGMRSLVSNIRTHNSLFYFNVKQPSGPDVQYRSDGTASGTFASPEVVPDAVVIDPTRLTLPDGRVISYRFQIAVTPEFPSRILREIVQTQNEVETILFSQYTDNYYDHFTAFTYAGGQIYGSSTYGELWRIGTSTATSLKIGTFGTVRNMRPVGDRLVFDGVGPNQMYSLGPSETTLTRISNNIGYSIVPTMPDYMVLVGTNLFFTSAIGGFDQSIRTVGQELYVLDTTTNIPTKIFTGEILDPVNVNGTVYFAGRVLDGSFALYKTNGTVAGTSIVRQFTSKQQVIRIFASVGNTVFFGTQTPNGDYNIDYTLWKSSGTLATTATVGGSLRADRQVSADSGQSRWYTVFNNQLYFRDSQNRLRRTDGTTTVTITGVTAPNQFQILDNHLFVTGTSGDTRRLYKVAAASDAAVDLAMLWNHSIYENGKIFAVDGEIWFLHSQAGLKNQLRAINPDTAAIRVVGELENQASQSGSIEMYLDVVQAMGKTFVLYAVNQGASTSKLFVYDGSALQLVRVLNTFYAPSFVYGGSDFVLFQDCIGLWRSDGTAANTVVVETLGKTEIAKPYRLDFPGGKITQVVGDHLYFIAALPTGGCDLRILSLEAPSAPSNLVSNGSSSPSAIGALSMTLTASGASLQWVDNSDDEEQFILERSTSGNFASVDSTIVLPRNSTSYSLTDASDWHYRVSAINAGGQSAFAYETSIPAAPVAHAGGPYTVNEGAAVPLNPLTSTGAQLQFEWDFNFDGVTFTKDASGASPSFVINDGPGVRAIAVRVIDAFGRSAIAATTVSVANVAPSATFAPVGVASAGQPSSVSFTGATDPSSIDLAAGLKYSFDFNDDGDFTDAGDVLNSTLASASFTFPSVGSFNVRGRITDKDGDSTSYSTVVTVSADVALSPLADATVRDGSNQNTNYGSLATLEVKKDGTGNYRESYLRFDLGSIASLTHAKLRLFGKLSDAVTGGVNVSAYGMDGTAWTDASLTYANRPTTPGTFIGTANVPSKTAQWIEWDLSSYLQAQKSAGKSQVTIALRTTTGGALITFNSQNAISSQPQLVVTQGVAQTPQGIVLSTNSLSVTEGSSSAFTVKLAAAPTSDVIVNIARTGDADLSSSVASLIFTPANWNSPQTVNIFAATDADLTNGSATFTLTSTGLTSQAVIATELDTNTPPPASDVTLSPAADATVRDGGNQNTNYGSLATLEVKKDGTGNYRESYLRFDLSTLSSVSSAKLRLFGKLSDPVAGGLNVSVYAMDNTAWTDASLTYANRPTTPGTLVANANVPDKTQRWIEWDLTTFLQAQKSAGKSAVTLVLRTATGGALITFNSQNATSSQPQLVVSQGAVQTPQAIVVSTNSLNVAEGSTNSLTVKLATTPTSDVIITLSKSGDGDLTTPTTSLTFTAANWNVAQSVTLSAAEDSDTTNGVASFTLSSSGLTNQVVTATEVDNDAPSTPTVLNALADGTVRDGSSQNTNYGSAATLEVKKDGTGNYRESYLKFDLTLLTNFSSAKLRLYGKLSDLVAGGINVSVYDAPDTSWLESSLTYATRPTTTTAAIATANVASKTATWIEWDLTSYLLGKKAEGRTQVTLALKTVTSGALVTFDSRAGVNAPQIVVS